MSQATTPAQPAAPSQPDTADVIVLDADELPAFCPNPRMPLWSLHPRVFLDLAHDGQARCPYCSTRYTLKPGVKLRAAH
ncbi:MAG: zinc-finger domain-containing protein [Lautropia sp.]|nr:zinc-finger domain-containing protein [Lautropia sp.]